MNGIRSGKSQSGPVVFTLTNIKMKDIESYLCMLRAAFGDSNQYDDLKLAVKGNCRCFYSMCVKIPATSFLSQGCQSSGICPILASVMISSPC